MRVVFAVSTPHQAHLFRNTSMILQNRGDEVLFLARNYGYTADILRSYNLPFRIYSRTYSGLLGKVLELLISEVNGISLIGEFRPDVVVGDSLLGYPSLLFRVPSISFVDGDYSSFYEIQYRTLNRSSIICTPYTFRTELGARQIRYPGFQQLAYLHPNRFRPDHGVLQTEGIGDKEAFSLIRFNAFDAISHDLRYREYDWEVRRRVISLLQKSGRVLISSEGSLPVEFEHLKMKTNPSKIHSLLSYAKVVIAETSIATEAAILGTPSVLIHPSVSSNLATNHLEMERFGLQRNFSNYQDALPVIESIMKSDRRSFYSECHSRLLSNKIDVTPFVVWLIDKIAKDHESISQEQIDFSQFIGNNGDIKNS